MRNFIKPIKIIISYYILAGLWAIFAWRYSFAISIFIIPGYLTFLTLNGLGIDMVPIPQEYKYVGETILYVGLVGGLKIWAISCLFWFFLLPGSFLIICIYKNWKSFRLTKKWCWHEGSCHFTNYSLIWIFLFSLEYLVTLHVSTFLALCTSEWFGASKKVTPMWRIDWKVSHFGPLPCSC